MITKHEMVMHVSQFVSASYLFMLNWTFFHHYRNYEAFMSLQEMHAQEDICLIQLKPTLSPMRGGSGFKQQI